MNANPKRMTPNAMRGGINVQRDSDHQVIERLRKIIQKNEQKLAYFQNRLKQAQFMDRPNQRMLNAAGGQANSYADGLGALQSQLQELERLSGGGVKLRTTEKRDLRWIWRWTNQPALRAILRTEPMTFQTYVNHWHRWVADADTQPFSIDLATAELIGFILIQRTPRPSKPRRASLEFIIIRPDYRYRGYGAEALKQAIAFVFEQFGVDAFTVQIDLENEPAFRCFEKSGIRSIKIESGSYIENEMDLNLYDMGIRREDWGPPNSTPVHDDDVASAQSTTHLSAKLLAPLRGLMANGMVQK